MEKTKSSFIWIILVIVVVLGLAYGVMVKKGNNVQVNSNQIKTNDGSASAIDQSLDSLNTNELDSELNNIESQLK